MATSKSKSKSSSSAKTFDAFVIICGFGLIAIGVKSTEINSSPVMGILTIVIGILIAIVGAYRFGQRTN